MTALLIFFSHGENKNFALKLGQEMATIFEMSEVKIRSAELVPLAQNKVPWPSKANNNRVARPERGEAEPGH